MSVSPPVNCGRYTDPNRSLGGAATGNDQALSVSEAYWIRHLSGASHLALPPSLFGTLSTSVVGRAIETVRCPVPSAPDPRRLHRSSKEATPAASAVRCHPA